MHHTRIFCVTYVILHNYIPYDKFLTSNVIFSSILNYLKRDF